MDLAQKHAASWIFLLICGVLEVVWAYTMKLSHGFTVPLYTAITIAILAANLFLLEKPVSVLGIGVSYGVFTGLGIVGTTLVGIIGLGESISAIKIASIAILMVGVIGLKYCDSQEAKQAVAQMANTYNEELRQQKSQSDSGHQEARAQTSVDGSFKEACTQVSQTRRDNEQAQSGDAQ